MKVVLEKNVSTESYYYVDGIEFTFTEDDVFVQIQNSYVKVSLEEFKRISRMMA